MITTDAFIERMRDHWTKDLGLACSQPLEAGWRQMATAFERQLNPTTDRRWQVLQLPTGTGKTQATAVYCSMMPILNHPGILIVTRFTSEANQLAERINKLSRGHVALAHHSESPTTLDQAHSSPVLVVTHSAYRNAVEQAMTGEDRDRWDALTTWLFGSRRLCIIDEAIDLVRQFQVNVTALRVSAATLRGWLSSAEQATIDTVLECVDRVALDPNIRDGDRYIFQSHMDRMSELDFEGLRVAIRLMDDAAFATSRSNLVVGRDLRALCLSTFEEVEHIARSHWAWISEKGPSEQLNSAMVLVIEDTQATILDATASVNPAYQMDELMDVIPRPSEMRDYGNVLVHVSRGHRLGKGYLSLKAETEWPKILAELSGQLSGDRKLLVCCHKAVAPTIRKYAASFAEMDVATWGSINGRNGWSDYDAVAIVGLPYLDDVTPSNIFMAHHGKQSEEWLSGSREFGELGDVRRALNAGHIAESVVQAINRIRCRAAIGPRGECQPCDVFLLLPNGEVGDAVTDAISEQMPGVRFREWQVSAVRKQARPIPTQKRLLDFIKSAAAGTYGKSEIISNLSLSLRSFERLVARLRTPSDFADQLGKLGVQYVTNSGRGREGFFLKS